MSGAGRSTRASTSASTSAPPTVSIASKAAFKTAPTTEPLWLQRLLIGVALAFMTLFLFVPLATVFIEALRKGVDVYLAAITEPDAVAAIKLTLLATAISVPVNLVFGVAAAWAVA